MNSWPAHRTQPSHASRPPSQSDPPPPPLVVIEERDGPVERSLLFLLVALVPTIPLTVFRFDTGAYYLPIVAVPFGLLAYWCLLSSKFAPPATSCARQLALSGTFLCAWAILSLVWSEKPQVSSVGSLAFYVAAVVIIVLFQRRSAASMCQASTLLLVLMTCLTAYGLYIFATGQDWWFQFTSVTSTSVGTRNSDAFMVVTVFPMAISRVLVPGSRTVIRLLSGAAGALCIAAVLLSLSRASTIGLLAVALIMMAVGARLIPINLRTLCMTALLAAACIFLIRTIFATSELSLARFSALDQSSRISLAQMALDTGLAHPLTGIGYSNFAPLSEGGQDAHDAYLNLFAELGIPGLAMFVTLLAIPLMHYIRLARHPSWKMGLPAPTRILYLQGFGMLLTVALLAATDTFYKSIYFWIVYLLSVIQLNSLPMAVSRTLPNPKQHHGAPTLLIRSSRQSRSDG